MLVARTKVMYWAPTRRRHYANLSQAAQAEAGAMITKRWREQGESGLWGDNPSMVRLRWRLARMIESKYRRSLTHDPR